ncbi:Protein kinase C-binding protein 1 [Frankliniella fusca]|uniref:Protein kinase C-binding protein 1 n=1 Tax=Frankliniella fusca TaxID=407009 RepID=A0AAE1HX90_9NEOP|nr:Protein kinase C-binding protein 1 [Frankliniella fusca]
MHEQEQDTSIESKTDQGSDESISEGHPALQYDSSLLEAKSYKKCEPAENTGSEKHVENQSGAPILLSAATASEVDPENILRSPPKLVPAVVATKRKSDETMGKSIKPLTGSMKNTPASLSIIDAPTSTLNKSTRSTRSSIDPSFAAKQRSFLNKVHNALSSVPLDDTSCESDQEVAADEDAQSDMSYVPGLESVLPKRLSGLQNSGSKRRREDSPALKGKISVVSSVDHSVSPAVLKDTVEPVMKKRVLAHDGEDKLVDIFCWICHREDPDMGCATCPRAYHESCLRRPLSNNTESEWMCPECVTILKAENQETRSKALKMLTLDQLCKLLLFAVERMKYCSGANVFESQVDSEEFPTYHDYIVNPMYLALLEKNIKKKMYGSTEAFVADASWIVHNCIVFNSINSKLTSIAKNILRVCKQEMAEIENCPDCYNYAYTADENWFIQVCQKPHVLVWAKLKGFPYWPAKAMRYNSDAIDVRFFGAHDRAWIPARDCYLYSQENPNPNAPTKTQPTQASLKKRNPKNNLDICIEELESHIQLLKERFSTFQYAPPKTPVNPKNLESHLKFMLPEYKQNETKPATPSKSSQLKRNSIENLKTDALSIEPIIKRMKADSSSRQKPFKYLEDKDQVLDSGKAAVKQERNESKIVFSKPKTEAGVKIKSNTTIDSLVSKCPENTNSSREICRNNSKPASTRTLSGESQMQTTSLSPKDISIAELRLKKKDARKIGLVDRLQEKIALWVARETTSDGKNDHTEPELSTQEQANGEEKAHETSRSISPSENLDEEKKETGETLTSTEISIPNSKGELNCAKIDVLGATKPVSQSSVSNFLQSFHLNKNQPKVMLRKLVMQSKPEDDSSLDTEKKNFKTENLSDGEVGETARNNDSHCTNTTGKRVIVSELTLVNDDYGNDNEKTKTVTCNSSVASPEPKLRSQHDDPVTSTTSNIVKSSPITNEVSKQSSAKLISEVKSDHAKSGTSDEAQPKTDTLKAVICKEEPESDPESTPEIKSATPENNPVDGPEKVENPLRKTQTFKLKRKSSPSRKTARKSVTASTPRVAIEAKRTENNSDFVKKLKIASSKLSSDQKPALSDSEETANIVSLDTENSNNDTDSQLSALKALLSKNVTVCLENSSKKDGNEVVLNTEKVKALSDSTGSSHVVSLSLPNSKAKTIVIQSGNTKALQESPPKIITSFSTTSHAQRLAHGATSILKVVKSSSPGELKSSSILNDGEQPSKHPAPRTYVVKGNIALSRAQSTNSSPVKSTFVTVSQSSTGAPLVRRLLPKAIPLAPPLSTTSSGTSSISVSNKADSASPPENVAKVTQRISVRSLSTTVTSTTASPKPVPPLEQSTQAQEERSILRKSLHEPLSENSAKSSANLREMPPLSIASVCSLQPSIQTLSGLTAVVQTSSSSKKSVPKMSAGIGPLSSELQSQAGKMTDVFMSCLKDCLSDLGNKGSLEAQIRCLQLDIEHMQWQHQQEIEELRHNTEVTITEVKDRMKMESQIAVNTALANARKEKEAAVEATKEKQWCAFCKKEAMFYCCWNTSYCDYRCQQNHWPSHSLSCTQNTSSVDAERHSSFENGQVLVFFFSLSQTIFRPFFIENCFKLIL